MLQKAFHLGALALAQLFAVAAATGALPPSSGAERDACLTSPERVWRSSPARPAELRSSLNFSTGAQAVLDYGYIVRGPCAPVLARAVMELVQLEDGTFLLVEQTNRVTRRTGVSTFEHVISGGDSHPMVNEAEFIMAAPVHYYATADGFAGDFIGLWRHHDRWRVAAFSKRLDGSFTTPEPILESTLPTRSLAFFPHIDTAGGRIGLVQLADENTAHLVNISWHYGDFFPSDGLSGPEPERRHEGN